jgi:Collagen triple helix repeat (20 copies)
MSDPTIGTIDLEQIEADERREKIRNRILIGFVAAVGMAVSVWVGSLVNDNQDETVRADAKTEQAQVEKFNLAQQIAAACADPNTEALDEDTYSRLCADARTIVRAGPQGAQGIPGAQGVQGIQGVQGVPGLPGAVGPAGPAGADGATGEQGPAGADGQDGAIGPQGPAGADGQPPFAWTVYDEAGRIIERCERAADFSPSEPTYRCTGGQGG